MAPPDPMLASSVFKSGGVSSKWLNVVLQFTFADDVARMKRQGVDDLFHGIEFALKKSHGIFYGNVVVFPRCLPFKESFVLRHGCDFVE